MKRLLRRCWEESRLLWRLAFPALLTEVFQFSIGFVTTGFVGHLGEVELAAVSVVENILDSSAYGVLVSISIQFSARSSGIAYCCQPSSTLISPCLAM